MERLEGRELLAYTPLGFSLPDLSITGFAAPAASWGGTLNVTVNVKNTGASTLIEPLALTPGAVSTADAAPTTVSVFASRHPNSTRGQVFIGQFATPLIRQNSFVQLPETLTLPTQPAGFPGDGGAIYLRFVINPARSVVETDVTNDVSNTVPVLIEAPFPQLEAVGLDVPPVMQPGDTIQPNIRVANLGTTDTSAQGTVNVALIASVDKTFGPGSSVIAIYQVPSIPPVTTVPTQDQVFGEATLNVPNNVVTINGAPVTLPARPRNYFIGVVVDPFNQIKQLGKIGRTNTLHVNPFSLIQHVGPPITNLPPAGVINPGGGANNLPFPFPVQIPTNPNVTPAASPASPTTTTPTLL